jgi:multiple sugar transport system substrate-binding protein
MVDDRYIAADNIPRAHDPVGLMRKIPAISHLFVTGALLMVWASACIPVEPTATPGVQTTVIIEDETGTASPTNTPVPSLGVDPISLVGIEIDTWHAFAGEAQSLFDEQVSLFNAVNDWGIIIRAAGFGDYLTLDDAMQAGVGEGKIPQLVITLPEQSLAWQAQDLVIDLGPYRDDPQYGFREEEMADFPAAFWTGIGAPAQRSARFLYYNQTWAHELGFTAPPQTPDEFRQQACAANASFKTDPDPADDGFGGWVVDDNWQTVYSWLLAFGGSPVEEDSFSFNSEENQEALAFLKNLYDDNCAWLMVDDTPYQAFAARKALFVSGDLAEMTAAHLAMDEAGSRDEWTLIPFPGLDNPLAVAYGPSYTLLRSSPEEQLAAWLFTRWMLSADNQARWVEMTGLLPLRFSVMDLVAPYRNASPQWESAANTLDLMQTTPELVAWRKARYLLEDGVKTLFLVNLPVGEIPSLLDEMQDMALELGGE